MYVNVHLAIVIGGIINLWEFVRIDSKISYIDILYK